MKVFLSCLLSIFSLHLSGSLIIKAGLENDVREIIVGESFQISYELNSSWSQNQCYVKKDDLGILIFPPVAVDVSSRPEGWTYQRFGDVNTECGIEVPVTDKRDNGVWSIQSWALNLTVKVPPSDIEGTSSTEILEVDQLATFNCSAKNSRPAATVTWTLDGEESPDLNDTISSIILTPDNLFDVHDMLTMVPKASYDGRVLQCNYFHDAITGSTQFEFNLTVHGPPDPEEFFINYPIGLVLGYEVRLEFQVHSNPSATSFAYLMHDLDYIIQINYTDPTPKEDVNVIQEGRYRFEPITETGNLFTSVLIMDKLLESDVDQEFTIIVTNDKGSTNYTIMFENPESVGLSSGAIAGIVIGVIIGIGMICLVAFYLKKSKKSNKKKEKMKSTKIAIANPVAPNQAENPN